MLGSGLNNCYCHLRLSKKGTDLTEPVISQPYKIVEGLIYGIHTLVSCCVAGYPICISINHHKSLLCYCRLHACGLSYDSDINIW